MQGLVLLFSLEQIITFIWYNFLMFNNWIVTLRLNNANFCPPCPGHVAVEKKKKTIRKVVTNNIVVQTLEVHNLCNSRRPQHSTIRRDTYVSVNLRANMTRWFKKLLSVMEKLSPNMWPFTSLLSVSTASTSTENEMCFANRRSHMIKRLDLWPDVPR